MSTDTSHSQKLLSWEARHLGSSDIDELIADVSGFPEPNGSVLKDDCPREEYLAAINRLQVLCVQGSELFKTDRLADERLTPVWRHLRQIAERPPVDLEREFGIRVLGKLFRFGQAVKIAKAQETIKEALATLQSRLVAYKSRTDMPVIRPAAKPLRGGYATFEEFIRKISMSGDFEIRSRILAPGCEYVIGVPPNSAEVGVLANYPCAYRAKASIPEQALDLAGRSRFAASVKKRKFVLDSARKLWVHGDTGTRLSVAKTNGSTGSYMVRLAHDRPDPPDARTFLEFLRIVSAVLQEDLFGGTSS